MEFIGTYLQSRGEKMRNIINLIKYNLTYDKGNYIAIGVLLIGLFLFSWVPAINIVITLIFLPIYLFDSISTFISQISRESGRLMFMVSIKGWEFMVAKYLEFIIVSLLGVILFNSLSFKGEFLLSGIFFVVVFSCLYISITSVIIIASSYLKKRWMGVALGILGAIVLETIFSGLYTIVRLFTPLIYVSVGGIKIDLIIVGLGIMFYISLIILAIKHFDNKLEIN